MENALVFIDAGYLSHISKHFGKGKYLKIDYNQLAISLAKKQNLWCAGVYYYTAPPYQSPSPTEDEITRRANYDKFVNKVTRIPNFRVREGRCQKGGDDYIQKGVDTMLVMDLMDIPQHTKTIILLACDTDFVPILNRLRTARGIKVILYYFSDYIRGSRFSMSNHILTACDETILLDESHFQDCLLREKE
ncbi:MAG: NYN domain-containing protein [Candidatus Diapherotrites archaeon]|nr:NYN domain-containing protein [Candidatus Diapherotrites archaeon]